MTTEPIIEATIQEGGDYTPGEQAAMAAQQAAQQAERDALAARVHGSPPDSEQAVRAEYDSVQRQLAELREERLRINDRIRDLVARDELLVKVVRLYDRAAAVEDDA